MSKEVSNSEISDNSSPASDSSNDQELTDATTDESSEFKDSHGDADSPMSVEDIVDDDKSHKPRGPRTPTDSSPDENEEVSVENAGTSSDLSTTNVDVNKPPKGPRTPLNSPPPECGAAGPSRKGPRTPPNSPPSIVISEEIEGHFLPESSPYYGIDSSYYVSIPEHRPALEIALNRLQLIRRFTHKVRDVVDLSPYLPVTVAFRAPRLTYEEFIRIVPDQTPHHFMVFNEDLERLDRAAENFRRLMMPPPSPRGDLGMQTLSSKKSSKTPCTKQNSKLQPASATQQTEPQAVQGTSGTKSVTEVVTEDKTSSDEIVVVYEGPTNGTKAKTKKLVEILLDDSSNSSPEGQNVDEAKEDGKQVVASSVKDAVPEVTPDEDKDDGYMSSSHHENLVRARDSFSESSRIPAAEPIQPSLLKSILLSSKSSTICSESALPTPLLDYSIKLKQFENFTDDEDSKSPDNYAERSPMSEQISSKNSESESCTVETDSSSRQSENDETVTELEPSISHPASEEIGKDDEKVIAEESKDSESISFGTSGSVKPVKHRNKDVEETDPKDKEDSESVSPRKRSRKTDSDITVAEVEPSTSHPASEEVVKDDKKVIAEENKDSESISVGTLGSVKPVKHRNKDDEQTDPKDDEDSESVSPRKRSKKTDSDITVAELEPSTSDTASEEIVKDDEKVIAEECKDSESISVGTSGSVKLVKHRNKDVEKTDPKDGEDSESASPRKRSRKTDSDIPAAELEPSTSHPASKEIVKDDEKVIAEECKDSQSISVGTSGSVKPVKHRNKDDEQTDPKDDEDSESVSPRKRSKKTDNDITG